MKNPLRPSITDTDSDSVDAGWGDPSENLERLTSQKQMWLYSGVFIFLLAICALLLMPHFGLLLGMNDQQDAAQERVYQPRPGVAVALGTTRFSFPGHLVELTQAATLNDRARMNVGQVSARKSTGPLVQLAGLFRYPDMATLSSQGMVDDRLSKTPQNTDWVILNIRSYQDGSPSVNIHTVTEDLIKKGMRGSVEYNFVEKTVRLHDLEVFMLEGVDPKSNQKRRAGSDVFLPDLFVMRNAEGRIETQIRCSNSGNLAAACQHTFSLVTHGVPAVVTLEYRRSLLEGWHEMQHRVGAMILSYKVIEELR